MAGWAMAEPSPIATLNLVGAHPALDFANTMGALPDGTPREYLVDYDSLVAWAQRLALVGRAEAASLRKRADAEPDQARRVLLAARDLRGAIYGVLAAHAVGAAPAQDALERFNRHLARAQAHAAIAPARDGFRW